jgi:hypothetical protein
MCHGPERASRSIYRLLPAQALALQTAFDESVPDTEQEAWATLLEDELSLSPAKILAAPGPDAPLVTITVSIEVEEGRGDNQAVFIAARGRAIVSLHRARVEVLGTPGVATDRPVAIRKAMKSLAGKVALILTW